jgi:drug/metabolite transporter (DMT)-like permease
MSRPPRPVPVANRIPLDLLGFWVMLSFSVLLAVNNLAMKYGVQGFQPVVLAGLRSAIAVVALALWMRWRGIEFRLDLWAPGLMVGACFAFEFFLLFIAMDMTTLVRAAILFYAMPLWTAVLGHFLFPGERLTPVRLAGFLLGFLAVALTLAAQAGGGMAAVAGGSIQGDLAALAAGFFWTLIVVVVRKTRIAETLPETQLFWQLLVSAVLLLALAPVYGGDWFRAVDGWQIGNLLFQALGIACFAFVLFFWLLRRYPASTVASFSFVTPVLSVGLGWAVLGEEVSAVIPVAVALLAAGLYLINRR